MHYREHDHKHTALHAHTYGARINSEISPQMTYNGSEPNFKNTKGTYIGGGSSKAANSIVQKRDKTG